jgi:hypothetical protein
VGELGRDLRYNITNYADLVDAARKISEGRERIEQQAKEFDHRTATVKGDGVPDDKTDPRELSFNIKDFPSRPGWRNWQTQRTQNPPTFGSWGFDSPSRHHS